MNAACALPLDEALSRILNGTAPVSREAVPLSRALGRVTAESCRAQIAEPCYDQSTRDGFVIGPENMVSSDGNITLRLCGEIPAGSTGRLQLKPRSAYRIMTGGLVPEGAERVVQQEECILDGAEVNIPVKILRRPNRFIQRVGSEIEAGTIIVEKGVCLNVDHIAMLAATANSRIAVFRKPRVGFFCSGSELTDVDGVLAPGQKISSNKYMLDGLIRQYGAEPIDFGIVRDDRDAVRAMLDLSSEQGVDLLISTGGVGPGKYDLFKVEFQAGGGELLYESLAMRPGKATLGGWLGGVFYFGLPGPPTAVNVLFHVLIGPCLKKMAGLSGDQHDSIEAFALHDLASRSREMLQIREGVLCLQGGRVFVRYSKRQETADCHIFMPPGERLFKKGDLVEVRGFFRSGFTENS